MTDKEVELRNANETLGRLAQSVRRTKRLVFLYSALAFWNRPGSRPDFVNPFLGRITQPQDGDDRVVRSFGLRIHDLERQTISWMTTGFLFTTLFPAVLILSFLGRHIPDPSIGKFASLVFFFGWVLMISSWLIALALSGRVRRKVEAAAQETLRLVGETGDRVNAYLTVANRNASAVRPTS